MNHNLPTVDWDGIARQMAETNRTLLCDEGWIGGDPDGWDRCTHARDEGFAG
jgi:hypothetical protein